MEEKTCTRCRETKPLAEFNVAIGCRGDRAPQCKTCRAVMRARPGRAQKVLVCLQCDERFPNPARQGPDRKFCSPECKIKYYNHQRTLRPRPPRMCPCGAPAANQRGKPVCAACRIDDRSRPYRLEYYLEYTLRQHGLTRADYDRTLAAQDGRCAICRSETPKGPGRWHIDHDHVTGAFRGLLCNNCNRGIGFFGDDDTALLAAAAYIVRHRQALAEVSG